MYTCDAGLQLRGRIDLRLVLGHGGIVPVGKLLNGFQTTLTPSPEKV